MNEHGYMFLIALFHVTDDTVLIGKSLLQELGKNFIILIYNRNACKILLYIIVGLTTKYFTPNIISHLEALYSISQENGNSKKDSSARLDELKSYIREPLESFLANLNMTLFKSLLDDPVSLSLMNEIIFSEPNIEKYVSSIVQILTSLVSTEESQLTSKSFQKFLLSLLNNQTHHEDLNKLSIIANELKPFISQYIRKLFSSDFDFCVKFVFYWIHCIDCTHTNQKDQLKQLVSTDKSEWIKALKKSIDKVVPNDSVNTQNKPHLYLYNLLK